MTAILADIRGEARRLLDAITAAGVEARLIGGMAVCLLAGDRLDPAFDRDIADLDFVVGRRQSRKLADLLVAEGYVADEHFNALNGARRMLFFDLGHRRQIDIFVEQFVMCHEIPIAQRLTLMPDTLPAAEVLMTKLQIVSLNAKDRDDLYALLASHEVAGHDDEAINADLVARLAGEDWGLQHTFELNLQRLRDGLSDVIVDAGTAATITRRIDALADALAAAPKSRKWRLRARVGERKQWYEEPEEVSRGA